MPLLPITSQLNPLAGMRNVIYLAEIAALTRLTTGVVRVVQNQPSKLQDPKLSMNQKRQAFWERVFVELFGTAGYIFFLHLGQDLASKVFEKKLKIPKLSTDNLVKQGIQLDTSQTIRASAAVQDVFGPHQERAVKNESQGLIHRVLYGQKVKNQGKTLIQRANLSTLHEKLGTELFQKVRPMVEPFAKATNRAASLSILSGVVLSALYGGFVTQALNDRAIAPMLKRFMKWRYGDDTLRKAPRPKPPVSPPARPAPVSQLQGIHRPASHGPPPGPALQPVSHSPLAPMGSPSAFAYWPAASNTPPGLPPANGHGGAR